VYATHPYGELHLRSSGNQIRYDYVLDLDPGDVIKLQLAGQGTGTDITFDSGEILMRIF